MRHLRALVLTGTLLVAGCSGGHATDGTTTSGSSSASASTTSAAPASTSSAASTPASPVAVTLPAGHRWLAVPALKTRLAIPATWKPLDLAALRDQVGTPAFAKTADSLGYTVAELTDFTSSGAVAMAVGPDTGDTAPNILVRSVGGGRFTSGDQLTRVARGATGVLDAQSLPTTPAGPGVRGDFHMPVDGSVVHASQLAVSVGDQQDLVTVAAADAPTATKVMGVVQRTYSSAG